MTQNSLVLKVKQISESAPVVIFMKGLPEAPQCGFSARACETLEQAGAKKIVGVNVLEDEALWEALEVHTQWPTVPQIFIGGQFVGGCDITVEMHESGELQEKIVAAQTK